MTENNDREWVNEFMENVPHAPVQGPDPAPRQINMVTNVRVRVVFSGDDAHEFDFADMVEGRGGSTPDVVADDELVRLAATYLDRDEADFRDLEISRPVTGNILIAPKPVFGSFAGRQNKFDKDFEEAEKRINAVQRGICLGWAVVFVVSLGLLGFLVYVSVMALRFYGVL